MALKIPLPPSQIELIVGLEANPDGSTADRIKEVLEQSNDRDTVVYGLRALSRFGVDKDDLDARARRFNGRLSLLQEPGQPFFRKDPPYITSYVVEDAATSNLKRIYLSGIIP